MTDLLAAPVARPTLLLRPRVARRAVIDVDVVIVGYHSRDLVMACLDSLPAAADGAVVSATVVDNGSNDGTVEAVKARGDGTRVIDMGSNTGFAVANNAGMARGTGRYVLVLNPDTVVSPGALRTLVEFADRHRGAGVVAPRLLNADGTRQLTGRAFPTPAAGLFGRRSLLTRWFPNNRWSRAFLAEREHVEDGRPFEVDWVSGAAMLVPRSVHAETAGFDEDFFLYWEDTDWCRRIKDAGYSVWCVPAATVVHDEGGTRNHAWSARLIRAFHRGAYRYWAKHHAPQWWHPLRWTAAVLLSVRAAALILASYLRPTPTGNDHSS
jgi:N-acetylglucosaminyl-diphospho-decaprenol L-rhamnosyltransferase